MISKIHLSPDLKITSRENTTWTQGDETNNIYLYVPDETIQLVELFVTKPGGMVNIDTVKFIKGIDEEGNSIWLAPNGIPSKLFQFTIYTGLTAQATFSFKLHSGINILDIKYKTTINTIWTINKSDASITENDETNETQQWRAIGSLSNDIVLQRNDFNDHLAHNVPDEVTEEDPDVHGVREALDRLTVEVTQTANNYTDQEIEVLDGDLTFYIDTLDQNMDNKKVDKSTALPGEDVLYTRTGANVETVTPVKVNTIENGVVPRYDSTGTLSANNPTNNTHVVNKQTMESNINDHNTGLTTHQDLRNLISDLNAEIDRLDGKGRSYGEIAATQSVLLGLSESARNVNINNDIAGRFPGYTPANGDLIYTNEDSEQNIENSHEWEYNSLTWVDNGAYTVQKASNSTFGLVKGGNSYVSIAAGIVSVLLSDYATRIGTSGGNYTYANLQSLFNDRYTKSQVDSLLDNLKAIYGWTESELVEITGSGAKTINKTLFADYDFILLNHYNDTKSDSFLIKPEDMLNGRVWESNISHVTFTSTQLTFTSTASDVLIATGIKMTPIDAKDVTYLSVTSESTTVKAALDELYSPQYETSVYNDLTSEITATDTFNIKDESGELIKIERNEPENLFINNITSWLAASMTVEAINDRIIATKLDGGASRFGQLADIKAGDEYYFHIGYIDRSEGISVISLTSRTSNFTFVESIYGVSNSNSYSFIRTMNADAEMFAFNMSGETGATVTVGDYYIYNLSKMKSSGVKNDQGILLSQLTGEEIMEQIDIWVENGWPTKVEKIISKSDNLFDAKFKPLTNLDSEAIIVDGTIPSGLTTNDLYYTESDEYKAVSNHYYTASKNLAVPNLSSATDLGGGDYRIFDEFGITVDYNVNSGIYTLNGTATPPSSRYLITINNLNILHNSVYTAYYVSGEVQGTSPFLRGRFTNHDDTYSFTNFNPPTSNVSRVREADVKAFSLYIQSTETYTFNNYQFKFQIEQGSTATDYELYAMPKKIVKLSDLIVDDMLPGGLENNSYLDMIVNQKLDNVPLRESNLIAVEPGISYKIIKASTIESTHKLVEYTSSNELVKVTDIVYTNGKSQVLTMDSTTSRVKIVSDLLDKFPNLIKGGGYIKDATNWVVNGMTVEAIKNKITATKDIANSSRFGQLADIKAGDEYYFHIGYIDRSAEISHTSMTTRTSGFGFIDTIIGIPRSRNSYSFIATMPSDAQMFAFNIGGEIGGTITIADYYIYNISRMKSSGVRNDTGTLFSRLTNNEIESQMQIWIRTGFPDHVINALYPNGADTAISFKYNDADDIFRALETDEMRINLELRSGEYWENGYVVKQNGNAQYFPLDNSISAWNYGQLEAVYSSGIPANFSIKYPINTSAQILSTSNYLQEARKQLDYVTNGYNNLVDQLGALIDEDGYNSFVGITSEKFGYYNLDGVTTGNKLKIVGTGQSVQNLLPSSTIAPNFTQDGLTFSYDPDDGTFTVNGTFTGSTAKNFTLAENIDFNLPSGTEMQLMRYYVDGTIDLQGSYVGYVLQGASVNHRIHENSESLYDPYINASGSLSTDAAVYGQRILFQVWGPGMVFNNFQFKLGIYEGLKLQPYVIPGSEPAKTNVTIYNRNENALNLPNSFDIGDETSDVYISYDNLSQEFLVTGTATSTRDISLTATFPATLGQRFSIKRVYQAGDVKDAGGVLPVIKLVDTSNNSAVENTIYERIPDTEETTLPTDITFNTGSTSDAGTLTLKLRVTSGQQFQNYRFRLMIHDNATDISYVPFERHTIGTMIVGKDETAELEFDAIDYGILEFVAQAETLNLLFGSTLGDLSKSTLEYNSGIASPTRKITELDERVTLIDEPYKDKVIAIWGDSRESNNPTSDPSGVGDQLDTSWPALLANKTGATVLNYGLSGGCWTENTYQQDAASAIVNRVSTQDVSASADVIIISVMNDFKLASPLGSPLPTNKDKTTFYGAMRVTYETLATKYPGKKIYLVLPQKRYDEDANYGGGSYYHYLKAQVEVANEYGIPVIDLYNNMPGVKNTAFYTTYMLNDTHWNAAGNDRVAELVMRTLLGNGNKGNMDRIPPIPQTDGAYTLQVTIASGVPTFTWVLNT